MSRGSTIRTGRHAAPLRVFALGAVLSIAPVSLASASGGSFGWSTAEDNAICRSIAAAMDKAPASEPVRFAQAESDAQSEEALTGELSEMLQACSYDGSALTISARALAGAHGSSGAEVVGNIMRFTGLPQNFKVVEGEVPNAAAMIVMGPDNIPERVIAYSPAFMEQVRTATENNDWASVSIMAHEIGHHLSGHTLMPGGSRPPVELEADKFSGFVLFKMGAALDDAQTAIATLVPEADNSTHPGRAKRLVAIDSGWKESCRQQEGADCSGAVLTARAETPPPAPEPSAAAEQPDATGQKPAPSASSGTPAGGAPMPDIPKATDIEIPKLGAPKAPAVMADVDLMPKLDQASTPWKFDRFIYDEVGIFEIADKLALARLAFQYAASNNIEIVTIVAKDLQGRTADQYALDAMRQLRVGKLDVGNGAVLVVAPETGQVGVALGAGLLVEYEDSDPLRSYLESYLDLVAGGSPPNAASDLVAEASYRIMRDTKAWEWVVRFPSLEAMLATAQASRDELEKTGARYDPQKDPTWRKLARVRATVVTRSPAKDDKILDINEVKERRIGPAMHVRTAEGQNAVLYVNSSVIALMPVPLEEGKEYAFVVRDSFLAGDTPQFDLISYDLTE